MNNKRPETPQMSVERALAVMVTDAMSAIMQTTATVERDMGPNRVRLELQGQYKRWFLNDKEVDIRDIVQILTKAPNVRAFGA